MAKLVYCPNCKQYMEPDPRKKKAKNDRGYWESDLKICPICDGPTEKVKSVPQKPNSVDNLVA